MGESGLRQKAVHEVQEFLKIFLYLAPWFCAFATYHMWLLDQLGEKSFEYGTALINSLVLSKVILIGESLGLGTRQDDRPLIYSTVYKAFVFTVLAAVFHVLEETIRGVLHGAGPGAAFAALRGRDAFEILGRSLVMFFAFLPFFALRELGRVLGERRLADLFFRARAPAEPRR